MWLIYIAAANLAIMFLEYVYRNGNYGTFWQALPYTMLPILIGQLGLFNGFRLAPNLLLAGAAFTTVNVSLRIVNSFLLGEIPSVYQWAGVALLLVSTFLLKMK